VEEGRETGKRQIVETYELDGGKETRGKRLRRMDRREEYRWKIDER
jgi:hypothetical protein